MSVAKSRPFLVFFKDYIICMIPFLSQRFSLWTIGCGCLDSSRCWRASQFRLLQEAAQTKRCWNWASLHTSLSFQNVCQAPSTKIHWKWKFAMRQSIKVVGTLTSFRSRCIIWISVTWSENFDSPSSLYLSRSAGSASMQNTCAWGSCLKWSKLAAGNVL